MTIVKGKRVILALSAVIVASCTITAAFDPAWRGCAVGGEDAAGSYEWDGKKLSITGGGAGIDVKGADQLYFVHIVRDPGDFEVSVRMTGFIGEGDAVAGIMARKDSLPASSAAALFYRSKDNAACWKSRLPAVDSGKTPHIFSGGIKLVKKAPPIWLRMIREGGNFAVYRSRDGKVWSMISNVSGGPLSLEGPVMIGFFAAGGVEGKKASAVFDNISVGAPGLGHRTSWVGNSFGSRESDKHVSNALSAMWVAPDGTCYTSSYWDEGGWPVTSYKDGKVFRPLPIGTPQTAEGGITGDGKRLYVASVDCITALDPEAQDFAPRRLYLSVSLHDKKAGRCVVSGLASNGKELFVSDSRDDLIRVVSAEPAKTYEVATAANDGVAPAPSPVSVPEGDARFAPEPVYQTQRVGEGFKYTLPGFTADATYTLRCHFAEYVERPPNCDPRNRVRSVGSEDVDVAKLAGGILKAAVKDFPGYKADAKGNIVVDSGSYGGPGLCGLEILDAGGKRLFAVNCGGIPAGDFKGECAEQLARNFKFERPGPMAFDKRGDLWIIQRGNDFPIGGVTSAKYKAAVKCFSADGKYTGREIADVVNPRALGYDPAKDELLVAENGPDLNVRFYGGLDKAPSLARTFGEKGGIFSGRNPGLVEDPEAGGTARFAGVSGVGVDAKGSLYVGGGFQGTDLRMFTPDGKMEWMLHSLMFCNTYDVDPDSDGSEIYGTYNHLHLDLSKTEPGSEQRYVAYNWDIQKYGEPVRAGSSQSILRRLGSDRQLVMFTSGQGTVGDINIFRYEGEIAVPCGGTRDGGKNLWIDINGDGREDAGESAVMDSPVGWVTTMCVDSKGDLWAGVPATNGSFMRHFFFKGINEKGVTLYSAVKGDGYEDVRFPDEGDKTNAWGMACRLDYDAERDIMVVFYPAVPRTGEGDKSTPQYFFGRYDGWSKGNRTAKWKHKALRPETEPEYFMYETDLFPYSGYMGMQVAGDYVFMAYLFGEVHVFELETGKFVKTLLFGPEVNGQCAWEDAAMGLRAFKRGNGEYLIFTENSGWGGKVNLFRWKP